MKIIRNFPALALTLMLAGCMAEPLNGPACDDIIPSADGITFFAQREPDCISRATLTSGLNVSFQPGDRISIFDSENINTEFTQSGTMGEDGTAAFKGHMKFISGSSFLALYPYMPDVASTGSKIGTSGTEGVRRPVFIPEEQKAVAGSFDPQAFISVAKSEKISQTTHKLVFHNACALVKFTIPEEAGDFVLEKAVLKTIGSGLLAGGISVSPNGSRTWLGPGSSSITLTGTIKAGNSYYFCTDARTVKGLRLELYHYSTDGKAFAVQETAADREIALVRNTVLDLGEIELGTIPEKTDGWYGSGTAGDPYQLNTLDDLKLFLERLSHEETNRYRSLHYRLSDDIDCLGDTLQTRGSRPEFCGVLDGNGHCISNYLLTTYIDNYQGSATYNYMFYRAYGATFKNLVLRPAENMYFKWYDRLRISFLTARTDVHSSGRATTYDRCRIEGSLNLSLAPTDWATLYFGGLTAVAESDNLVLTHCSNDADILFDEYFCDERETWYRSIYEDGMAYFHHGSTCYFGGFIGFMYCSGDPSITSIDRCRNNGNLTFSVDNASGSNIHVGGFIGFGSYAFIYPSTLFLTNSVNAGSITVRQGNSGNSSFAAGFVAFDQINGKENIEGGGSHYPGYGTVPPPHFYNCLNKGNITVSGNNTHAAGFAYLDRSGTQFALCVNIGDISAANSDLTAPLKAAISSGYGECRWCWWLEPDRDHPQLPCTLQGTKTNCYCYPTLNADTPNNRRKGVNAGGGQEIVLDETNSHWSHQQWLENTVPWTGGSKADGSIRTLDLDF